MSEKIWLRSKSFLLCIMLFLLFSECTRNPSLQDQVIEKLEPVVVALKKYKVDHNEYPPSLDQDLSC